MAVSKLELHAAICSGDAAPVLAYFSQADAMRTALRTEAYLASQPHHFLTSYCASSCIPDRVISQIHAASGDAWFLRPNTALFAFPVITHDAVFTSATVLFGTPSPLVSTTPLTLVLLFHVVLYRAMDLDDLETVELMLDSAVFRDHFQPNEKRDLLVQAVRRLVDSDKAALVSLLVSHGADVSYVDLASEVGVLGVIRQLARDGTEFQGHDFMFWTAGRMDQHADYFRGMLRLGVDARVGGEWNWTRALEGGEIGAIKVLVDEGFVDVDMRASRIGWNTLDEPHRPTALCMAAQHGPVEAVRLLLEHGADPNADDGDGSVVMDYAKAREANKEEVVGLLLRYGAVRPALHQGGVGQSIQAGLPLRTLDSLEQILLH